MTDFCCEQLLGYLLGALEESEEQAVKRRLETEPELRRHLAELQRALEPLEASRCTYEPPIGLASRTCEMVARGCREPLPAVVDSIPMDERPRPLPATAHRIPSEAAALERSARWSWLDLTVAATVVLVTSALVFPAIHSSRFQARVAACQNNLRELGTGLVRYSQLNRGFFPRVPSGGPLSAAGIYAPTLRSQGYLTDDRWVICPSSALAETLNYTVPTLESLESASGEQLKGSLPTAGGSYGYSLGYTEDGQYHNTRNLGRRHFALLADVPSAELPLHQSDNHGGRGQNVLFEDMHVEFLTRPQTYQQADDVFVNDLGEVAPGSHRDDSVIAPSTVMPVLSGATR